MQLVYKIRRGLLSVFSNQWNKMMMTLYNIRFGYGFRSCGTIHYRNYEGTISIGNRVTINSHLIADPIGGQPKTIIVARKNAKILIGNRVGISNTAFYSREEITVGDDAVIGAGCKIYDNDFHSIVADYRLDGNSHVKSAPVHIGNRTFIGGHTIILKGVTIGEGAVVAAGSVVTKSIPRNEIWGGNPAKFIKTVAQ